jgi:hypothetical protein
MKNRDAKKEPKRAERQKREAGKFPFHRAKYFKHVFRKVIFWRRND